MLFLLDANVLIDANRDYYPINSVPEFWEWLLYHGEQGEVKIPVEIYGELCKGTDGLTDWVKRQETKSALLFDQEVDIGLVRQVINDGYGNNLSDTEFEQLGNDPFLISYALDSSVINEVCIVTTEISKPAKIGANRRIPDVCKGLSINCYNSFEFFKALSFSTHWRDNLQ